MLELTQDLDVIVIHRQHNVIIYHRYSDNKSWVITGKCNETGECERKRMELDCPVTPEIKCKCGLLGVYC